VENKFRNNKRGNTNINKEGKMLTPTKNHSSNRRKISNAEPAFHKNYLEEDDNDSNKFYSPQKFQKTSMKELSAFNKHQFKSEINNDKFRSKISRGNNQPFHHKSNSMNMLF
jgi:hypothetical protein